MPGGGSLLLTATAWAMLRAPVPLTMLLAMGTVAGLAYERLGVGVLRRAWLNLDLLWATAIATAGLLALCT